jgi:hypothetical protein
MPHTDSLDKILGIYIGNVCREPFEFRGQRFTPRPLRVSPLIFRGFTCPSHCGGCCPKFSLDYLPSEPKPVGPVEREVVVNGRSYRIISDLQFDHREHFCRHLNRLSGRCGIYEDRPFSCDFELLRFIVPRTGPVHLTQKLFGRGWAMRRVDGGRGARCRMLEADTGSTQEVARKLRRLDEWARYFSIRTCLDEVYAWVTTGPHGSPLFVPAD